MVSAFEGNRAETKTMLPVIEAFMAAHRLPDVTVVADAGMVSEANQKAIEAAGLSFILGAKIPHVPYAVKQWRREHPGEGIPDGSVFTQPWPAGPDGGRRDQVIYYQYRHDRARRTLRGIDEQVKKAEQAVAGERAGEAEPVHPAVRRHQEREPRARGQSAGAGRDQGLCRCCGYAEHRPIGPGGARMPGSLIGIITGSAARRSVGRRGGNRRRGPRAGGSGPARRA